MSKIIDEQAQDSTSELIERSIAPPPPELNINNDAEKQNPSLLMVMETSNNEKSLNNDQNSGNVFAIDMVEKELEELEIVEVSVQQGTTEKLEEVKEMKSVEENLQKDETTNREVSASSHNNAVEFVPKRFNRSISMVVYNGLPTFNQEDAKKTIWQNGLLAFQTLGVIYGDLGTSPLYVYPTINISDPNEEDFLGILSIIIWTVTLVGIIKYVCIVLHADDHGEGGTFALYSLLCQHAQIGEHEGDGNASGLKSDARLSHFSKKTSHSKAKHFIENNVIARKSILFLVMLGTCMLIGDGILTPSISVLSSIEGIEQASPSITKPIVISIAVIILVGIFMFQRIGTSKISFLFSPIMALWLLTTAILGIYNICVHYPSVFKAFSPHYIVNFFARNGKKSWSVLGGTVLCITGAEAMFADLGHFNKISVQIAFSAIVYPSVLLQYAGQSAYLIKHPYNHRNAFYKSIPGPVYWPMFVVASLAAIVASQGLISASFSIVKQSVSLHYFPRVKLVHTSKSREGQVYSPEVNYILMILSICVTIGFQESATLGNAFGVAVMCVMFITTVLICLVMLIIWRTHIIFVILFVVVFGLVEGVYLSAVVTKIPQGGWLPFAVSIIFVIIMRSWTYGRIKRYKHETENAMTAEEFGTVITSEGTSRVPGLCFFYCDVLHSVPPIVTHYVRNVRSLHQVIIFMSIRHVPVRTILPNERFLVGRLNLKGAYRCIAQYGYMDIIDTEEEDFKASVVATLKEYIESKMAYKTDLPQELEVNQESNVHEFSLEDIVELENAKDAGAIFVLGKTVLQTTSTSRWYDRIVTRIYHFLNQNCRSTIDTWKIPYENFLELVMLVRS